ncbi:hypothetical protein PG1C_13455 [Rugosibacter aromaticivorans]|uniref:Group 1 truncated hemoglobin n=1 Tax=Rugosibacter aromaticivorans TaxID=1565605 RepID=A0A0C5JBQ4_9PROT|nr:group 1 truncated hemoglobin [Rugosibacter aromaticivorans]AJP49164.1 hypothetical protein PG1C_13455 [Rugosibacter aromaticivorans]TBR15538.1 MAG: group 1 truncated hemoglobin [Rugosibacter sp.]
MKKITLVLLSTVFSFNVYAAVGTDYTQPYTNDQLYFEFGKKEGLVNIVDDFMINLLADPRTRTSFEKFDQARIKAQLVEQFCEILGGPCKYAGAQMKPIHASLNIDKAQFNALVEALQKAMDKHQVSFDTQNKLLAKLAPMHRDIITR